MKYSRRLLLTICAICISVPLSACKNEMESGSDLADSLSGTISAADSSGLVGESLPESILSGGDTDSAGTASEAEGTGSSSAPGHANESASDQNINDSSNTQGDDTGSADGSTNTTASSGTVLYSFYNPAAPSGNDPWIIRDGDAYYYCYSGGNGVYVMKVDRLDGIANGKGVKVWTAPAGTPYSGEYWAPELHKINDKWYIYVAADDGNNNNHRMYVFESDDPLGQFQLKGKISAPTDKWAIDGTVLQYKGSLYFIWSGWEGDTNVAQNLYIAPMSNPWTISGERVCISTPTYYWETIGTPYVNEGPAALVKDDTVHIVYSASGSWTDSYCLGRLTYNGGDILDASNWVKASAPVLKQAPGAYGPGHCSFTTSPDGKQDFIVYHANLVSGTGWNGRSVRIQPFTWDGTTPVFGAPVSTDTKIDVMQY